MVYIIQIIIRCILSFIAAFLVNYLIYLFIIITFTSDVPQFWELAVAAAIAGGLWTGVGLCFRGEPFGLFLCIGPVLPLFLGVFGFCDPFAWGLWLNLVGWLIIIGGGCISATCTWTIFNYHIRNKKFRGFPVMQGDHR